MPNQPDQHASLTSEIIRETEKKVSASLVRISSRSGFFATLGMFARFQVSNAVPTAATDGRKIYVNPQFFGNLTTGQQDGLIVHEILHDALLHVTRRVNRDPKLWNIAADIVINGIIVRDGWQLPDGGLRDTSKEHLAVEEVYDILQRQAEKIEIQLEMQDLLDPGSGEPNKDGNDGKTAEERSDKGHDANKDEKAKQIEADWRNALEQAQAMVKTKQWGKMPGGMAREIGTIEEGKIDWRAYLWRYLTQTPTDFGSYDRRFVYQRAYYETISGESVRVKVAVDTSGSIEMTAVTAFLGEVKSILHAYPHLKCDLCFADTQIYGPYALTKDSELPAPEGGGGTDFRPFFEHIDQHTTPYEAQVAIYLTDGWGEFPSEAPTLPVLWVVLPGGRDLNQFPFGETVRLASAYDTAN